MPTVNDAKWWNEILDLNYLLGAGLLYEANIPSFSLAAGASRSFGGVTGNLPIVVAQFNFRILGSQDVRVERFTGGTISGGVDLVQFPRNQFRPALPTPWISLADGISINVPGTLTAVTRFSADFPGDEGRGFIDAPGSVHYTTVTNDDNQTADSVEVRALFARYRQLLS